MTTRRSSLSSGVEGRCQEHEEATRRVIETYLHLDANEEHLLWLALAAAQSRAIGTSVRPGLGLIDGLALDVEGPPGEDRSD